MKNEDRSEEDENHDVPEETMNREERRSLIVGLPGRSDTMKRIVRSTLIR